MDRLLALVKKYRLEAACLVLALGSLLSMELYLREVHPERLHHGIHFQRWTSDKLMQTIPVEVLRARPLQALWYLHIQPPALDAIRAVLASLAPCDGGAGLLQFVDYWLLMLWAVLHALLALTIFVWLRRAAGVRLAAAGLAVWLLNPAAVVIATLPDGTLLSTCLFTWLGYELWRVHEGRGTVWRLAVASLLLFFTRTMFQWFFFPVLLLALVLMSLPRRKLLQLGLLVLVVVAPYLAKQQVLFGTLSTSTFSGQHKLGLIWHHPYRDEVLERGARLAPPYPPQAELGQYNVASQVWRNLGCEAIFGEQLRRHPADAARGVVRSIWVNAAHLFLPTQDSIDHQVLMAALPATLRTLGYLFSPGCLVLALLLAGLWLVRIRGRLWAHRRAVGLALVPTYAMGIMLIANRYGWTEVDRLKFVVEPTAFVFVLLQGRVLLQRLRERRSNDAS